MKKNKSFLECHGVPVRIMIFFSKNKNTFEPGMHCTMRSISVYDDVTCGYDDVTCVYDDVTYVNVTHAHMYTFSPSFPLYTSACLFAHIK